MNSWKEDIFDNFVRLKRGYDLPDQNIIDGIYPVVASTSTKAYHKEYKVKGPGVVTGRSGSLGAVQYVQADSYLSDPVLHVNVWYDLDLQDTRSATMSATYKGVTRSKDILLHLVAPREPIPKEENAKYIWSVITQKTLPGMPFDEFRSDIFPVSGDPNTNVYESDPFAGFWVCQGCYESGKYSALHRVFLCFDTRYLQGKTLTSAYMDLQVGRYNRAVLVNLQMTDWFPRGTLRQGQEYCAPAPEDFLSVNSDLGWTAPIQGGQEFPPTVLPFTRQLTPHALGKVNTEGYTYFSIRVENDITGYLPEWVTGETCLFKILAVSLRVETE